MTRGVSQGKEPYRNCRFFASPAVTPVNVIAALDPSLPQQLGSAIEIFQKCSDHLNDGQCTTADYLPNMEIVYPAVRVSSRLFLLWGRTFDLGTSPVHALTSCRATGAHAGTLARRGLIPQ